MTDDDEWMSQALGFSHAQDRGLAWGTVFRTFVALPPDGPISFQITGSAAMQEGGTQRMWRLPVVDSNDSVHLQWSAVMHDAPGDLDAVTEPLHVGIGLDTVPVGTMLEPGAYEIRGVAVRNLNEVLADAIVHAISMRVRGEVQRVPVGVFGVLGPSQTARLTNLRAPLLACIATGAQASTHGTAIGVHIRKGSRHPDDVLVLGEGTHDVHRCLRSAVIAQTELTSPATRDTVIAVGYLERSVLNASRGETQPIILRASDPTGNKQVWWPVERDGHFAGFAWVGAKESRFRDQRVIGLNGKPLLLNFNVQQWIATHEGQSFSLTLEGSHGVSELFFEAG